MAKTKPISPPDSDAPGDDELADLLGESHAAFRTLAHDRAGTTCDWKRYSKKGPWVLKVNEAARTLYYLVPQTNQFDVTVVLASARPMQRLPAAFAPSFTRGSCSRSRTSKVAP